jgi:hypothetical protein
VLIVLPLVLPFMYSNRSAMALRSHKAVVDCCDRNAVTGESIMLEPIGPAVDQFVLFRKRPPPAARISETN